MDQKVRRCKVCGSDLLDKYHAVQYCDICRAGIIDETIPATASVRWRLRHPAQAKVDVRRTIAKKPKSYTQAATLRKRRYRANLKQDNQ